MTIYRYGNKVPEIGKDCFISDSARVIGDVTIGNNCYIGHGSIIRGDYGKIEIGNGTAIEENAVLHIRPDGLLKIENNVTIGHGAIVHGKLIKENAVVGMGAVISFDVVVGKWSIIAEGCVLNSGIEIGDEKIVAGVPHKIIGRTMKKHKEFWTYGKRLYNDLAKEYPLKFEKIG